MRKVLLVSPTHPLKVLPSNNDTVRELVPIIAASFVDLQAKVRREMESTSKRAFFIAATSSTIPLRSCRVPATANEHVGDLLFRCAKFGVVLQQVIGKHWIPILARRVIETGDVERFDHRANV